MDFPALPVKIFKKTKTKFNDTWLGSLCDLSKLHGIAHLDFLLMSAVGIVELVTVWLMTRKSKRGDSYA